MSGRGPSTRAESDALVAHGGDRLERLLEIMRRLRDPRDGCPWDRAQSFETIAPYTVEEAYEVADAIARGDMADLRDELGDLLLQVVYHARLAQELGAFDFADVTRTISDKMLRRHPHVFAGTEDFDWEAIKAQERADKERADKERADKERADKGARRDATAPPSALDGVALNLPALTRAEKLQARAARVGFDWPATEQVLTKIQEESAELLEASRRGESAARVAEEFGDLLFVMANLARHLGVDPETALRGANAKFARRFQAVEAALAAEGRTPEQASLEEMDAHWDAVKAREAGGGA